MGFLPSSQGAGRFVFLATFTVWIMLTGATRGYAFISPSVIFCYFMLLRMRSAEKTLLPDRIALVPWANVPGTTWNNTGATNPTLGLNDVEQTTVVKISRLLPALTQPIFP